MNKENGKRIRIRTLCQGKKKPQDYWSRNSKSDCFCLPAINAKTTHESNFPSPLQGDANIATGNIHPGLLGLLSTWPWFSGFSLYTWNRSAFCRLFYRTDLLLQKIKLGYSMRVSSRFWKWLLLLEKQCPCAAFNFDRWSRDKRVLTEKDLLLISYFCFKEFHKQKVFLLFKFCF